MSEKIVVLNSGGFDSVVLMNCIHNWFPNAEIHSLHFSYGARNGEQQLKCVEKVCKKINAISQVIDLPKFSWTKNNFYKEGYEYETQYLEYRNLIFLSYAISYAESIGAKKIYLATFKNKDGNYNDNTDVFYEGLNSFTKENSRIEIVTPFRKLDCKEDLLSYAIRFGLSPADYFSCDIPRENGEPCGECFDCIKLKGINSVITIDSPMKAFYQGEYNFSDKKFKELLSHEKPTEVRALINNDCQLKCKHCFYGFSEMKSEPLSKEEYYKVLKEFVLDFGIQNIHFSGKEPLYDDTILWYAEQIHKDKLPCTFNLVTNGINVPKYVKRLRELGMNRVYLSVDDVLNTNGVRSVTSCTDRALKSCADAGIDVEVFIDLHFNNYNRLVDIIDYMEKSYKVDSYYFRTIRSIGNADGQKMLTGKELNDVWEELKIISEKYKEKTFTYNISMEYIHTLFDTPLLEDIDICEGLYTQFYTENLCVMLEEYCSRYTVSYTFTPDGYILGCASEVALPDYDKHSVGNVRELPLKELVNRGSKIAYECNDCYMGRKSSNLECNCKYLFETP